MFALGILCFLLGSALGGYSLRRTIARRLGVGPLVEQGIVRPAAAGAPVPAARLPEVAARTLNILLTLAGAVLLWPAIGLYGIGIGLLIFGVDAVMFAAWVRVARRAEASARPRV